MLAVVCHNFGPLEGLRVEEVATPEAADDGVVVAVEAAGVNFVDTVILTGGYQFSPRLPYVPGSEVAGTVVAVGAGVTGVEPGTRVVAQTGAGGFAEFVAAPARSVVALPDGIGAATAATVMQSYSTALFALTVRDHVQEGETVVVLGAGGGVGLASVDVATSLGARVIAVASTEAKRSAAMAAGAVAAIDPAAEDLKLRVRELTDGGADVVVDPVGGALAEPALRALRFGGRFLVVGFAGGAIPRVPLNLVLLNSRTIVGIEWGGWLVHHPGAAADVSREILEGITAGRLHPVAPVVRPLTEAAAVLADLAGRRVTGKVALTP